MGETVAGRPIGKRSIIVRMVLAATGRPRIEAADRGICCLEPNIGVK